MLAGQLAERRNDLAGLDPAAADLADELVRLIAAGGERLRPAFLSWGHLAAELAQLLALLGGETVAPACVDVGLAKPGALGKIRRSRCP